MPLDEKPSQNKRVLINQVLNNPAVDFPKNPEERSTIDLYHACLSQLKINISAI